MPAPDFLSIADEDVLKAFRHGHPETTEWLKPGTKLFKWTASITTKYGVSPWWSFLEPYQLSNGVSCPGIRSAQEYAARIGVHDRDYARTLAAVSRHWNKMTTPVAIELQHGAWGYVGIAAGQRIDNNPDNANVYFIGGAWQVWIPGIALHSFRQISLLPYLEPNSPFHPR